MTRPSQVRYGLDGQARNEGQRTMQGARDLPADLLPARLGERRSMPGRRTSALSKVETDSAVERPRTKDVRRATSPFDAPVRQGTRTPSWRRLVTSQSPTWMTVWSRPGPTSHPKSSGARMSAPGCAPVSSVACFARASRFTLTGHGVSSEIQRVWPGTAWAARSMSASLTTAATG